MLVKILKGMPFLVDPIKKEIYAYEKPIGTNLLLLGTYTPETEEFVLRSDWKEAFNLRLEEHRESEKPRSRKTESKEDTKVKLQQCGTATQNITTDGTAKRTIAAVNKRR